MKIFNKQHKKILSLNIIFSILFSPIIVLAQITEEATPSLITEPPVTLKEEAPLVVDDTKIAIPLSETSQLNSSEVNPKTEDENLVIQEATPGQTTLPGNDLISTDNPQPVPDPTSTFSQSAATSTTIISADEGTSTPIPPPDPIASSTTPTAPTSTTTSVSNLPLSITPNPSATSEVVNSENEESVLATLSVSDLAPKREYVVSIAGPPILTDKEPEWQKNDEDKLPESSVDLPDKVKTDVSLAIAPIESDALFSVSGVCDTKYFVVLLYKNADDYNTNPGSYILNRAYPCQNNLYKYSINEIPGSFSGGTYYILIAGQEDTGPWKPITAITPITLAPLLP